MRPIVEVMTVNFSLLALDQIVNNAATIRHMSGGQFSVPARHPDGDRRRPPARRAARAQPRRLVRAHPGLRIVAPATLEDARGMLWTALEDPDPVLIFEHQTLYNMEGELADDAGAVDIDRAAVRRPGKDVSLITYGGDAGQVAAGRRDARRRRHRRGSHRSAHASAARHGHGRYVGEEDASRRRRRRRLESGSLSAEIAARLGEQSSTSSTRPLPASARRKCRFRIPSISRMRRCRSRDAIVAAARLLRRSCGAMVEFRMPLLGADMEAGTLVEWLKHPGDAVKRGDIIAVVDTAEGRDRNRGLRRRRARPRSSSQPGAKVPVGTVLAQFAAANRRRPRRAGGHRSAAAPACRAAPAATTRPRRLTRPRARLANGAKARGGSRRRPRRVTGTGASGAVTREDVERAAAARAGARSSRAAATDRGAAMRAAIAAAMADRSARSRTTTCRRRST